MKIALVTTTVRVPEVLRLYARLDPTVGIFVAGDLKSPHDDIALLCRENEHSYYIHPDHQGEWECSSLIPWNCVQRRNIAFLEALKWGADVIASIDDDNIPTSDDYFRAAQLVGFTDWPWSGLQVSSPSGWVDPGHFLLPPVSHRGFPHDVRSAPVLSPVVDARVGVAAGFVLGDSDIGAVLRIASAPRCRGVHEAVRHGVVVAPDCRCVFNSQNTAVARSLVPAWFMMPHVGRYDDIFASLVVQAEARRQGLQVHLGPPFVYQERNEHDLLRDLEEEMFGMRHIHDFSTLAELTVSTQHCYEQLTKRDWFPPKAAEAALAWLRDCERVMA